MKNLILGIALIGLAVGCKTDDNNQVSDASTVEAPEGACGSSDMCDAEAKAECESMKGGCNMTPEEMEANGCNMGGKEGCSMEGGEKADAAVCPMTGEVKE